MTNASRETTGVARGTTLQPVAVAPRRWEDYRGVAPDDILEDAAEYGRALRGTRILHVNATAYGGGVAELLASEIGLLRDVGVQAEWRVICPDAAFFEVTKQIHNAMQGKAAGLSDADRAVYLERNAHCAAMLEDEWDVVVVHDPQPAALRADEPAPNARWIWRCHIDTSTPDLAVWAFLRSFVTAYDAYVFTLASFAPAELAGDRLAVIAPAIDPLATKNCSLPRFLARSTTPPRSQCASAGSSRQMTISSAGNAYSASATA